MSPKATSMSSFSSEFLPKTGNCQSFTMLMAFLVSLFFVSNLIITSYVTATALQNQNQISPSNRPQRNIPNHLQVSPHRLNDIILPTTTNQPSVANHYRPRVPLILQQSNLGWHDPDHSSSSHKYQSNVASMGSQGGISLSPNSGPPLINYYKPSNYNLSNVDGFVEGSGNGPILTNRDKSSKLDDTEGDDDNEDDYDDRDPQEIGSGQGNASYESIKKVESPAIHSNNEMDKLNNKDANIYSPFRPPFIETTPKTKTLVTTVAPATYSTILPIVVLPSTTTTVASISTSQPQLDNNSEIFKFSPSPRANTTNTTEMIHSIDKPDNISISESVKLNETAVKSTNISSIHSVFVEPIHILANKTGLPNIFDKKVQSADRPVEVKPLNSSFPLLSKPNITDVSESGYDYEEDDSDDDDSEDSSNFEDNFEFEPENHQNITIIHSDTNPSKVQTVKNITSLKPETAFVPTTMTTIITTDSANSINHYTNTSILPITKPPNLSTPASTNSKESSISGSIAEDDYGEFNEEDEGDDVEFEDENDDASSSSNDYDGNDDKSPSSSDHDENEGDIDYDQSGPTKAQSSTTIRPVSALNPLIGSFRPSSIPTKPSSSMQSTSHAFVPIKTETTTTLELPPPTKKPIQTTTTTERPTTTTHSEELTTAFSPTMKPTTQISWQTTTESQFVTIRPNPNWYTTTPQSKFGYPITLSPNYGTSLGIDEDGITIQIYNKAIEVYQKAHSFALMAINTLWPPKFELSSNTIEPLLTQPLLFMLALGAAVIGLVLTMMLVVYIITYQIQPKDDISIY